LPGEFDKYRLPVVPELIHHLLAFASLYIGEGAVMASEAGVLGIPWIYVSSTGRCYLQEQQETYGLGWHTSEVGEAVSLAESILARPKATVCEEWQQKRRAFLEATDDVTDFMIHTITEFGARSSGAPSTPQQPP
jgi:predicted glycosyltransferase